VDADPRLATLNDVAIAASFLMFLAVVVCGLLLLLFSWITAGLPPSAVTCSQTVNCVAPEVADDLPVWIEGPSVLKLTVSH
jgi:hypothetical protein